MSSSHRLRTTAGTAIAAGATAAVLAATPAGAAPALRLGAACYSTGDVMRWEGEGFTASAPVDVSLTGASVASTDVLSDPAGLLRLQLPLDPELVDALVRAGAWRQEVVATAVDRRAAEAGAGPAASASAEVLVSHFGAAILGQPQDGLRPARRMTIEAHGFTGLAGRRTYLHYVRGGRRVATVRLGVLQGPCGDVRRTLRRAFPFRRVRSGRWTLVLNLSRTDHRRHPQVPMPSRVAG